tara:strand:+ start:36481 stop:36690 length:210 start_codon:yes stop_codon:yes gene_type:complete
LVDSIAGIATTKKVSRIQYSTNIDDSKKETWHAITEWRVKHMANWKKFKQPLLEAEQMKKTLHEPVNTV